MERKQATERLRELLDEEGIDWAISKVDDSRYTTLVKPTSSKDTWLLVSSTLEGNYHILYVDEHAVLALARDMEER